MAERYGSACKETPKRRHPVKAANSCPVPAQRVMAWRDATVEGEQRRCRETPSHPSRRQRRCPVRPADDGGHFCSGRHSRSLRHQQALARHLAGGACFVFGWVAIRRARYWERLPRPGSPAKSSGLGLASCTQLHDRERSPQEMASAWRWHVGALHRHQPRCRAAPSWGQAGPAARSRELLVRGASCKPSESLGASDLRRPCVVAVGWRGPGPARNCLSDEASLPSQTPAMTAPPRRPSCIPRGG